MLKIKSIFKFKNGQFWKKKWRWDAQLITHKDLILIFENRWRPLQQWLIILHIKNHRYLFPSIYALNIEILEFNKNAFQSNANCPLANRCLNKLEQIQGGVWGRGIPWDLWLTNGNAGSGDMGTPTPREQNDSQTRPKTLPFWRTVIMKRAVTILKPYWRNLGLIYKLWKVCMNMHKESGLTSCISLCFAFPVHTHISITFGMPEPIMVDSSDEMRMSSKICEWRLFGTRDCHCCFSDSHSNIFS